MYGCCSSRYATNTNKDNIDGGGCRGRMSITKKEEQIKLTKVHMSKAYRFSKFLNHRRPGLYGGSTGCIVIWSSTGRMGLDG